MKHRTPSLWMSLSFLFVAGAVYARNTSSCEDQTAFIESQSRCAGDEGIPLATGATKVACFADPAVQSACGPEGRMTRLHAFTDWLRQLKNFQDQCAADGGDFAFADAQFVEPTDENFCSVAQPELGSSFFEEPTCNFRSQCPTVQVVCQKSCSHKGDMAAARETADLLTR